MHKVYHFACDAIPSEIVVQETESLAPRTASTCLQSSDSVLSGCSNNSCIRTACSCCESEYEPAGLPGLSAQTFPLSYYRRENHNTDFEEIPRQTEISPEKSNS